MRQRKTHGDDLAAPRESVSSRIDLVLRPRRLLVTLFLFCVSAELALFLLDWNVNYGRLIDAAPVRNLFNTTREDGLASWFGVTQTALAALTLWLVYLVVRARGQSRWTRLGWLALALFFSYMAFDDGAQFHERIGSTFAILEDRASESSAKSGAGWLSAFPSYPWQVIFMPGFAAMGLFMLVFLWRELGTDLRRGLVLAGVGCFAVAVGLDFVEGLDEEHALNLNARIAALPAVADYATARFERQPYEVVRHFGKSVEEILEMLGMTLIWMALLGHAMHLLHNLRFTSAPRIEASAPDRRPLPDDQRALANSSPARLTSTTQPKV